MTSTFLLEQQKASADVYIYPNGDLSGCTELIAYGVNPNYACVDEELSDDDTTYVFSESTSELKDLYELPNQSLSGNINYIQVFTKAKSYLYSQHENSIYKIICSPNSVCTNVYKSIDYDLTTGYSNYNKIWTQNPSTVTPWTWTDINALSIGVECSSLTILGNPLTATFRPNDMGTVDNHQKHNCYVNYMCVDEEVSDGDNSYLTSAIVDAWRTDLYNIPNHTTETGIISKIVIFAVMRWFKYNEVPPEAKIGLRTNATNYWGDSFTITDNSYNVFSEEWTINPNTSVAWTWSDIDALEIGWQSYSTDVYTIRTTQVYMVVYYNENVNPEIRTTQCYAKINYTPPVTNCSLNKPNKISYDHDRNIKMLNFWDGTREVYDLSRNSKSVVMSGKEFFEPSVCSIGCPCERIQCVRDMGLDGSAITISGFTGIRLLTNGIYKIHSFGWKKISDSPIHYEWILELESAEL